MIQKAKTFIAETRELFAYLWRKRRRIVYAYILLLASLVVVFWQPLIAFGLLAYAYMIHTEESARWTAEITAKRAALEVVEDVFRDLREEAKNKETAEAGKVETPSLVKLSVGLYANEPITRDMSALLMTFIDSWVNQARQAGLSGVRGCIYDHGDDGKAVPMCVFDTDKL